MLLEMFHSGGKIGVNMFLFISGWYLCDSEKFNIKRPFYLMTEVFLYSVIFVLCGILLSSLTVKSAIRLIFAIPFGNWEFITCYFMMICFSYWINQFLKNISLNQMTVLIAFMSITWSIFPDLTTADFGMSTLTWYLFIYILAAYVKRIYDKIQYSSRKCLVLGCSAYGCIFLSEVTLKFMGRYHIKFAEISEHFRNINSVFLVLTVVFIFLSFIKMKPQENKVIQLLASTSLAVFIIHHNDALRSFIWTQVFHNADYADSPFLILHAVITVIIIFTFGFLVDMLRQNTIGKLEKKIFDKKLNDWQIKLNDFMNRKQEEQL